MIKSLFPFQFLSISSAFLFAFRKYGQFKYDEKKTQTNELFTIKCIIQIPKQSQRAKWDALSIHMIFNKMENHFNDAIYSTMFFLIGISSLHFRAEVARSKCNRKQQLKFEYSEINVMKWHGAVWYIHTRTCRCVFIVCNVAMLIEFFRKLQFNIFSAYAGIKYGIVFTVECASIQFLF